MTLKITPNCLEQLRNGDFKSTFTEADLKCDNPMGQEGLFSLNKINDKIKNPFALNRYEYRLERVFCHACGARKHYKGITIETEDGTKALIGNCCAKIFFGDDAYDSIERDLSAREANAFYSANLASLDTCIKNIFSEIRNSEHLCRELDNALELLNTRVGNEHYNTLKNAANRNDGRLTVDRKYENPVFIETGKGSKYELIAQILGRLRGAEFLSKTKRITSYHIPNLYSQLRRASELLHSPPKNNVELKTLWILVTNDCRENTQKLLNLIFEGCDFFSQDNVDLICRWLKANNEHDAVIKKIKTDIPVCFEKPKNDWMQEFRNITIAV